MRGSLPSRWTRVAALTALLGWAGYGCHRVLTPELHPPQTVPVAGPQLPLLKVHMRSGELFALSMWRASADGLTVEGTGTRYSLSRAPLASGDFSIAVDEVALFETNRAESVPSAGASALAIMSVVSGAVAAYCVANPKSCFGSCPTFYLERRDGGGSRPAAEGFSASIARALEARDVDALGPARAGARSLVLTMRNEAFETQAVRSVRLLAAERGAAGRVFASPDGRFYSASDPVAPEACRAPEGDCLAAVRAADGEERTSPADPNDLATRETLELDFGPAAGQAGLLVHARQTLLSTHLFYQTMAYFGSRAGELLAALERGGPAVASRAMGMARLLGGIDAEVAEGDGPWRSIGSFDEAGPIAGDVWLLPFEAADGPVRVRLRLAKGHWRLDQVALLRRGAAVAPLRLEPRSVERDGASDARALALLRHPGRHLVTLPGDAYEIVFPLPQSRHGLELFVESEGYYYEWMREPWLDEEDATMAALVIADPAEALRRMAGSFKGREADLERTFWASRFRR
jgi:hypothetical protein